MKNWKIGKVVKMVKYEYTLVMFLLIQQLNDEAFEKFLKYRQVVLWNFKIIIKFNLKWDTLSEYYSMLERCWDEESAKQAFER